MTANGGCGRWPVYAEPNSEATRCRLQCDAAPEWCRYGMFTMSQVELSRRAAPRSSAPDLSTARRGGEGWCAVA
jgi:hypothetical protein